VSTISDYTDDASPWDSAADLPRARLLVVDDQPMNIRALHEIFAATHDVFMATSGEQALAFCRATPPDLVLLDVVMPQISGLEVCRRLKQDPETASIPVIFVTALDNPEEEDACWKAGGVDFITKPISAQTTRHRVRAHLTLKRQADVLRRLAWIDGLTGLANKRQFDERWMHEWKRCRRDGLSLAVACIDIDNFKAFNDTYGHLSGDDCLRNVALAIRESLARPGDFAARTGGEEFTCVMPDADTEGGRHIAERIERAVLALQIPHTGGALDFVSVSVGLAIMNLTADESPESLLQRADRALYRAKGEGRARIALDEGAPLSGS
jgi:diguanylate cyclase (GGDEF)-like protein